MSNEAGKRLRCESCGAEVVVTKGGEGDVTCCSQPMVPK
jgi:desulfoferrodoxin-like iron-binding protein